MLLVRVDKALITRKQKLKLYRLGVCPRLLWDLTITEFAVSWLEKTLDPMATRYLKKWAGLARPADPARLFLPQANGGFNLPLPSVLDQKLQVGKASLLITSRDAGVNHAVRESLKKEQKQQRAKFQPHTSGEEAFAMDRGGWEKAVSRAAKTMVEYNLQSKRLKHSLSLEVQGKLFRIIHQDAAAIWAKTTQSLPSAQMKFALNAASDTLPHNANLSLWRKSDNLSAACKLCGERQTLCHILNNCKVALDLRRYNNQHDDVTVLTDLPDGDQYQFPPSLALSDLRPDLVAYSNLSKSATMVELTVCFETSFKDTQLRKEKKYMELVEEIEWNEFVVDLITLEVGSRGCVNTESFYNLNDTLGAPKKELLDLMLSILETAIKESFRIWIGRNTINTT